MNKPLAVQILAQPQTLYAVGVKSFWRKSFQQFFAEHQLNFVATINDVPVGATALVWGAGSTVRDDIQILHVEDGFVRSVGLGAEFARPASWVVDAQGLYFDATQPSDLETLLNTRQLSPAQTRRAERLSAALVAQGVSKYNLSNQGQQRAWQRPNDGRKVHLIVGQVESDASITLGAKYHPQAVHSNLELVKEVRRRNPYAYLVYKPHPDVVAGARAEGSLLDDCLEFVDLVVLKADITQLFEQIDALHCITSLSGFEALLRGIPVHCYGMPFYAGWGLTQDLISTPRRTRCLSLAELVHGALISYPLYINLASGQRCEVEQALQSIVSQRARQHGWQATLKQRSKATVRQLLNAWRGGAK